MVDQRNFAGNIAYDDLCDGSAMAERLGEVRTVKGAELRGGHRARREAVLRVEHGPCVVFEDIQGCPKSFRLLLNMFCRHPSQHNARFSRHLTKWGSATPTARLMAGAAHRAARHR